MTPDERELDERKEIESSDAHGRAGRLASGRPAAARVEQEQERRMHGRQGLARAGYVRRRRYGRADARSGSGAPNAELTAEMELAAREEEVHRREAGVRRAEMEAASAVPPPVDEVAQKRIQEHERALGEREARLEARGVGRRVAATPREGRKLDTGRRPVLVHQIEERVGVIDRREAQLVADNEIRERRLGRERENAEREERLTAREMDLNK
jgi:hypothetical protein